MPLLYVVQACIACCFVVSCGFRMFPQELRSMKTMVSPRENRCFEVRTLLGVCGVSLYFGKYLRLLHASGGRHLGWFGGARGGAQGGLKRQRRDVGGYWGRLCGDVGSVRWGKRVNRWFWTSFFSKMPRGVVDVVGRALVCVHVGL